MLETPGNDQSSSTGMARIQSLPLPAQYTSSGLNVSQSLKIMRTMIMLKSFQESNHIMLSLGG